MTQDFEQRFDVGEIQQAVQDIINEIRKVIIGQNAMIEQLIAALLADSHVLIEGVPGIAKTLTAKLLSRTIDTGFSRIQFTPDLMPSDVLGASVWNAQTSSFEFKSGPVFSNMILLDEINRAPAKTQSALFEVMEELQVTVDGVTRPMERPFMVIATQNPIEHEGTYRLPEAQLDRFLFKIFADYPTIEEEAQMLAASDERKGTREQDVVSAVISADRIETYQQTVKEVHIEPHLIDYIAAIVHQTRNYNALYLGASPRASLAIMNGAKAMAAIRGRDFISPDDIREISFPALRHRILLTPEREMEGVTPDEVIRQILEHIEVPR